MKRRGDIMEAVTVGACCLTMVLLVFAAVVDPFSDAASSAMMDAISAIWITIFVGMALFVFGGALLYGVFCYIRLWFGK